MHGPLHAPTLQPLHPGIWAWTFGVPEAPSPLDLREIPPCAASLTDLGTAPLPFTADDLIWTSDERGCRLRLALDATEELYGLGLQLKSLPQRGRKKVLRVNSDPIADTGDAHAPVPFIASTRGWGLLIDSARACAVYAGSARPAEDIVPLDRAIADDIDALYVARSGGRRELVIEIPIARGATVICFAGPTLGDVVRRHTLFAGGGCVPPLWGLGVWYRAWGKADAAHVAALASGLRADRLPCDVLGLEPGWQSAAYPCSFRWSAQRFPDHRALLARLHADGFRVNAWQHAFLHPEAPCFAVARDHSGPTAVFDGLVPDLTVPAMRAAFTAMQRDLVDDGLDGFKLDECDGSDFKRAWSFPDCDRFPGGLDGERMHALFGMSYLRSVHQVFAERGVRAYHGVRSAGLLAVPYPFVLYSDLYDHRDFLRGVPVSGCSGLLWAPEVRQCASTEDLVRRVQSAALSAMCLINAWMIPQPPWFQVDRARNLAGEAMPDRARATALVREALHLRMALIPYLDAAFRRYHRDGTPPFRALALDHPDDPLCRTCDDQWLLGEDLLCAPMIAGQRQREVILPPGRWHDLTTDEVHIGGGCITVAAPLERIPLFVRDGAILPLAEPVDHIAADTVFRLCVHVFGAEPRPCTLWEDDGASETWRQGEVNTVELGWRDGVGTCHRSGVWPGRRYAVVAWRHRP